MAICGCPAARTASSSSSIATAPCWARWAMARAVGRGRRSRPPTWPGTATTTSIPATPAWRGSRNGRRPNGPEHRRWSGRQFGGLSGDALVAFAREALDALEDGFGIEMGFLDHLL